MAPSLLTDLLNGLDQLGGGQHAGFRPVHAKGFMYSGTFTPSSSASNLTRAAHATRSSTPITVRFSLAAGVPTAADNDPAAASPQGIAVRFHLDEHVHTDIVAHSHNGFPVRTGEEFLEFLTAALASGPDAPNPPPIAAFLARIRRQRSLSKPRSRFLRVSRGRRISRSLPSSSRTRRAKASSAGFASCPRPGRSF
jgi:catalase